MQLPQLPENFFETLLTIPKPYPVRILKEEPWYSFTRHNGYIPFAQKLVMQIHSDFSSAEEIWEEFSPNKSFFDLWGVRKSFFEGLGMDPYFLTIYRQNGNKKSPMGVLPLWLDDDEYAGKYSWCGGYWPEDNTFFVKDPEVIPLLLMAAPAPTELACIKPLKEYEFLKTLYGFEEVSQKKYFLSLKLYKTMDDYLLKLKKKKRYNVRRDRKHILAFKPRTVYNEFAHIDDLFKHSIVRFRTKYPGNPDEYSVFESSRHQQVFRNLIKDSKDYKTRMISTIINGKVEAVELGFIYHEVYYAVCAGVNVERYPGLGVYSNLLVMEDALNHGCEKIDFLEGNYNWKDSWNLEFYHHYQFTK